MLRRAIAIGAVLAVSAGLTACASGTGAGGADDTTVRLGAHAPLTGIGSAEANEIISGMKAYFEYVNEAGGVNGRTIEFTVADDAGDPETAQAAVRSLVDDDHVLALVGSIGNATHRAVVDYVNDQGVPDLFVASAGRAWNDPETHPFTFAFRPDLVVEGKIIAQYSVGARPDDARCVLVDADDAGAEFAEGVALVLGADGIAVQEQVAVDATDVTAQVAAFDAAGCRSVFIGAGSDVVAAAVTAADGMGYAPSWLVGSDGGDYTTLAGILGLDATRLLEGMVSADYLPFQSSNDWVKLWGRVWVKSSEAGGYELTAANTFGMALAYTFTEALAKAGDRPTADSLIEALEGGRVLGAGIFPLTLSEANHAAYSGVQLTRVSTGLQAYMGEPYVTGSGEGAIVEYVGEPVPLTSPDGIPTP